MQPEERLASLRSLCPDLDEALVRDFIQRMDRDYFDRVPQNAMARHLALIARLDLDHPCRVSITEAPDGQWDLVVVAYDYFSEFATICGLLSAFGLDIREGAIYTLAEAASQPSEQRRTEGPVRRRRPGGPAGLGRKKIVDMFRVRPLPGVPFSGPRQAQLIQEFERMVRLLDQNQIQEVRGLVNRRLVETLARSRSPAAPLLNPIHITFDNETSPQDTVIEIRSADTPAFLYAFANALTMRGLYIRRAEFNQAGAELHDRFFVRGRHGQKILEQAEQQELRLTATLIKQFTQVLTWAPDPAKAIAYFDQFLDRLLEEAKGGRPLEFLKDKKTLTLLARLLGTSDFLWEDFLRRQHANLLPVLENYQKLPMVRPKADMAKELRQRLSRAKTEEQQRRALNQYKDRELFRIDMKHLLEPAANLPDFSRALTDLAEVVLDQASRMSQARLSRAHGAPSLGKGRPCPFAIFGMGKFGGGELGYASDIEVLFVYGGPGRTAGRKNLENSEYFERVAHALLQSIEAKQEGIFHLDVRLRPHGGKGPLANPLSELRAYYSPSGLSAPFERQALIKLRCVSGDETLGKQVEAYRDEFVYSDRPWDLATALELRQRQARELVDPGQINVKYSQGGLVDVEYAVQYLQLMHGSRIAGLRTANTLAALAALETASVLTAEEAANLREAYLFLRGLIDALRIVRGHAKDLVLPPVDSDAFIFLARRLGYTSDRWEEGATRLADDITRHMRRTRELFIRKFGQAPRA